MTEDRRVTEAKALAAALPPIVAKVVHDLADYAEERLRVNVGLLNENTNMKKKFSEPDAVDLSTVSTTDLMNEITRRVKEQ